MSSIIVIHKMGSLCKVLRRELLGRGHKNVRFIMETLNDGYMLYTGEEGSPHNTPLPNEGHFKSVTCISELLGKEVKVTLSNMEKTPRYKVTCDTGRSSFAASRSWGIDKSFLVLRLAVVNHSEDIKKAIESPHQS